MSDRRGVLAALVAAGVLSVARAQACDVCAIYTATELREGRPGLRLGVAEQLTEFGTLRDGGRTVANPADQRLTSAITQVLAGWNFTPRLGVQLALPIVSRTFRRIEDGHVASGDETGVGDLSLVANWVALSHVTEHAVLRISLLGGLKLPSGDSSRLGEELAEGHEHEDGHEHAHEEAPASGIHGHDLALGSGSVDGLVGGQLFYSWRRLFVTALGQYAARTRGDFGYRYANDLTWSAGPGVLALLGHRGSLGIQALFSGETKGNDDLDGRKAGDTAITALYVGPGFTATWGTSLGGEIAADLPVVQHNTGLQAVPDYRLRGGLTWRF